MGMEQETLIYIEENDKKEARILTQSFANSETKSRAYINALGAELVMKYLALENINNGKIYNLHNIQKILEELDISDIMLSNIHIDVRVVFDENLIFIPKTHFEYDILPDIYLVLNLSEDHAHAKFLGFFEPKMINKNNQNDNYYFIEKEKLTSPLNLKEFIENFKGNTTSTLTNEENGNAEVLMVSLMDQNVSKDEMKELLKYLAKSADLRDKFIEFGNFELLAYKSLHTPDVNIPKDVEEETAIDATLDDLGDTDNEDLFSSNEEYSQEDNSETEAETEEETQEEAAQELPEEQASDNNETSTTADININDTIEDLGALDNIESLNGMDNLDSLNDLEGLDGLDNLTEISSETDLQLDSDEQQNSNMIEELAELAAETAEDAGTIAAAGAAAAAAGATSASIELAAAETGAGAGIDLLSDAIDVNSDNSEQQNNSNAELTFDELNIEGINTDLQDTDIMTGDFETISGAADLSEENSLEDVQNFDSIEKVQVPQNPPEEETSPEMDILDISNVNAVPNNLDANISETIEFNNIEQADNKPCSNELSAETTEPTVNLDSIDSFNGLEPLTPEDMSFQDASVDLENLSAAPLDPMVPVNPPESAPAFDPFAPVDLDSISLIDDMPQQNNGANIQKHNEELANSLDENNLSASLDEIPNFGDDLGLGGLDELDSLPDITQNTTPQQTKAATASAAPEFQASAVTEQASLSEIPDLNAIDNLTAEDIVDMPAEDVTVLTDNAEASLINTAASGADAPESVNSELAGMDAIPDENPEFSEISGIDELNDNNEEQAFTEGLENNTSANDNSELTMLFDENSNTLANSEQIQTLDSPFLNRKPIPKRNIKTILASLILVGALLGGSLFIFTMKNKNGASELESLAQTEPETEIPAVPVETENLPAAPAPAATDNSDILANTPEVETIPATPKEPKNTKQEVKPAANNTKEAKPINPPGTYMSVKKLSWEVPDYLSYSQNIKRYLQTAGKSIKLSLSSDLLLTNEYAYSNQVKVSMKLSNDGTLKDIQIVKSSGSTQINNIVLQTVKDTLNVIKPATGEVPSPEFKLGLTINF